SLNNSLGKSSCLGRDGGGSRRMSRTHGGPDGGEQSGGQSGLTCGCDSQGQKDHGQGDAAPGQSRAEQFAAAVQPATQYPEGPAELAGRLISCAALHTTEQERGAIFVWQPL